MSFDQNNSSDESDRIIADINVTPLIDIMLVLLIIFMVTSSITLESGLDIDLPSTSSATTPPSSDAVIVSLSKDGQIFIQGKSVAMADIKTAIADALKEEKTSLVVFEGDKNATLGRTIEIMDLARSAGASKFAMATDQGQGGR